MDDRECHRSSIDEKNTSKKRMNLTKV
jgi:hypothetical protein